MVLHLMDLSLICLSLLIDVDIAKENFMKKFRLIGGTEPEFTLVYYQEINLEALVEMVLQ